MRFMMFVYPGDYEIEDLTVEAVSEMTRFNEELTKAGVVLAMDGLTPPSASASVTYSGGKPSVTDGPYAEAKEVVGGYWILETKSKEEALEWASRAPMNDGDRIEVRQIAEMEDYPEEIQQAATLSERPPA